LAVRQEQLQEAAGEDKGFEVRLDDFSGPLDLLCHLVDMRELDPVKLNLTELISQYVHFLVSGKRTTLSELAEFFSFASKLLLRKVHALFPAHQQDYGGEEELYIEEGHEQTEEELRRMLEVFRPYRSAAAHLAKLRSLRESCFTRVFDEDIAPFYDLGDLYSLSSRWYELLDEYRRRSEAPEWDGDMLWEDIPDAVPEERLVEERMEELLLIVKSGGELGLRELLAERSRKVLIVTLLALLEMSRLGMVCIGQGETLGDVYVTAT